MEIQSIVNKSSGSKLVVPAADAAASKKIEAGEDSAQQASAASPEGVGKAVDVSA